MARRMEDERGSSGHPPLHVAHDRPKDVRPRASARPVPHSYDRNVVVLRATPIRGHVLARARRLGVRRRRTEGQFTSRTAETVTVGHRKHRNPSRTSPECEDPELQASGVPGCESKAPTGNSVDHMGRDQDTQTVALARGFPKAGRLQRSEAPGYSLTQVEPPPPHHRSPTTCLAVLLKCQAPQSANPQPERFSGDTSSVRRIQGQQGNTLCNRHTPLTPQAHNLYGSTTPDTQNSVA